MMNTFEDIESTLLYQPLTETVRRVSTLSDNGENGQIPHSAHRHSSRSHLTQSIMSTCDSDQHWCFRKKTSLLAITITIVIVAIVTILLNLTLTQTHFGGHPLEVEESITPLPSTDNMTINTNIFIMNGSANLYDDETMPIFDHIPFSFRLVHLELVNVEVNPTLLFRAIRQNYYARTSLEVIRLINVTFAGTLNVERDLVLSNLKEFTIEINQQVGPFELLRLKNRNCTVNIFDIESRHIFSRFHHPSCIKSFIFFREPSMEPDWPFRRIHQMKTTKIDIVIFGYHIFTWDPAKAELLSLLHSSTEVLEDFVAMKKAGIIHKNEVSLKKIHLRDVPLKLSTLANFASEATYLTFIDVDFIHDISNENLTLSKVLSQFKSLEYLDMEHYFPYTIFTPKLNMNLNDLSKASNLKSLSISLVRLEMEVKKSNRNVVIDNLPRFPLNQLQVYEFGIESIEILNHFDVIFNGTKSIYWDGVLILSSLTFSRLQFWLNIMKIESLETVMFGSPPFTTPTIFSSDKMPASDNTQESATKLLNKLGMSEEDVNLEAPFLMQKDTNTGKWKGRTFRRYEDMEAAMVQNLGLRVGWNMFTSNETHSTHLKNEYYKLKLHCNI